MRALDRQPGLADRPASAGQNSSAMTRALLLTLSIAASTAGCSLSPAVNEPPLSLPVETTWKQTAALGTAHTEDVATLRNDAWWQRFEDEVLTRLITNAVTDN